MSNKQGQPNAGGSRKQEGEGNQGFQEKTKRDAQQEQSGGSAGQQGESTDAGKKGTQQGSQKDKNGKVG